MPRFACIGLALTSAALSVGAAHAHHSIALFAPELEGELAAIEWQNPHIRFALRARSATGAEQVWRLESSSIFLREQDGVTRDLFRLGDHVKVAGRPSRRESSTLLVTNMLLPDGREAPLWPLATARFVAVDKMIKGETRAVNSAAENRGYFRVWLPAIGSPPPSLRFKPHAIEARRGFDIGEFAQRCESEGMPRIMHTNVFPRELIDGGATIELRTELFDTVRTIHLGRTEPPPGTQPSRLGYSVGAWENGDLVVRTTLVDWPYFDNIGTPQSAEVAITERFSLSDDQSVIDYEMTVVDAETFDSPAVIRSRWQAFAGEIARYDCRAEP